MRVILIGRVAIVANYTITCVIKSDNRKSSAPDSRGCHITDVGFRNGVTMTVKDVYASMDSGNTFQTMNPTAEVRKYVCTKCMVQTLKSHTDGVPDNNLDNLSSCA